MSEGILVLNYVAPLLMKLLGRMMMKQAAKLPEGRERDTKQATGEALDSMGQWLLWIMVLLTITYMVYHMWTVLAVLVGGALLSIGFILLALRQARRKVAEKYGDN